MKKMNLDVRKGEKGFTLVELAIVMIIIGLLLGGVLKGQDLIKNAQVAAVVTEIKGFDAAINTFRDTYAGYPGDLRTPSTRIPNCTSSPCNVQGNGNGRIGAAGFGVLTADNTENLSAWSQMEFSGMISAVDGTNTLEFGEGLPQSAFGSGGYQIVYHAGGSDAANGVPEVASSGHYLQLGLDVAAPAGNGFIEATLAARIDRKMDNGLPTTGSVREVSGGSCTSSDLYDESNNPANCGLTIGLNN